jgi:hypothetical protein
MSDTKRVQNVSGSYGTWVGQVLADQEYFIITPKVLSSWQSNVGVMVSVSNGDLVVDDGVTPFDPVTGWEWLQGNNIPKSEVGTKIWVHQSSKPQIPGRQFHTVWTGSGDDALNDIVGGGERLLFDVTASDTEVVADIAFDVPDQGDVYIHEGYFMWENAPWGAHISIQARCKENVFQTSVNLDLEMESYGDGNRAKYAVGGPGTGTHGWTNPSIHLVPNRLNQGYWDYSEATSLTPAAGDGDYDILDFDTIVSNFIHQVPVYSTATGFNRLQSSDTSRLAPGYYLKAIVTNGDTPTDWRCWMFMTLHRERTF